MKSFLFAVCCLAAVSCFAATSLLAQADSTPSELRQFLPANTKCIAHKIADLNGDGLQDYAFVVEKQKARPEDPEIDVGQRILTIAIRKADGKLSVVKSNDKIVFCSTCGGVFGDPFDELSAKTKSFTVHHYGGSNWRWANTFTFNYSRIDNTWQLVFVEEQSYHTSNPDKMKTKQYKPPKDFGKIDIADFDPEKFKGVGAK